MADAPSLHDLAAHFGSAADAYERGRPEHPPEVIALIAEELGLGEGARILDLGAGTGKLTKGLTEAGFDVVAVEPLEGMREVLARRAPEATVVEGFAERIPLGDGSVDAVTVADAFHRFDPQPALAEIRRVLPPGAGPRASTRSRTGVSSAPVRRSPSGSRRPGPSTRTSTARLGSTGSVMPPAG
jgi:SAM-dependent methyltransferase